jgi:hypothetical protein
MVYRLLNSRHWCRWREDDLGKNEMHPKKYLVSVGLALTALISNSVGAKAARFDSKPAESPDESLTPNVASEEGKDLSDTIVQRLVYQTGNDQHLLLLRKPGSGSIYADHSSHGSHGSHSSHSSGN